jgi:hypothetical protein
METMRKFKVGDEIVRVDTKASWAHIGYTAAVLEGYQYLGKDFCVKRIFDHQWELVQEAAKSKWTIYNNTLPWSQLSDKQKGKLMVAENDGYEIKGFKCTALNKPVRFDCHHITYFAVEPVPVKPETIMADLFFADWIECKTRDCKILAEHMIAKGWTKSCK